MAYLYKLAEVSGLKLSDYSRTEPVRSLSRLVTRELVEVLRESPSLDQNIVTESSKEGHDLALVLLQPHPKFVALEKVVGLGYFRDAVWKLGSPLRRAGASTVCRGSRPLSRIRTAAARGHDTDEETGASANKLVIPSLKASVGNALPYPWAYRSEDSLLTNRRVQCFHVMRNGCMGIHRT